MARGKWRFGPCGDVSGGCGHYGGWLVVCFVREYDCSQALDSGKGCVQSHPAGVPQELGEVVRTVPSRQVDGYGHADGVWRIAGYGCPEDKGDELVFGCGVECVMESSCGLVPVCSGMDEYVVLFREREVFQGEVVDLAWVRLIELLVGEFRSFQGLVAWCVGPVRGLFRVDEEGFYFVVFHSVQIVMVAAVFRGLARGGVGKAFLG